MIKREDITPELAAVAAALGAALARFQNELDKVKKETSQK